MSILVDPPSWPAHGRLWSHLVSDVSFTELHDFADGVGLDRRLFEGDHYDVPEERYQQVVAAGAVPVESRELLGRLQRAGLRRRKRRGERVLASAPAPGGGRVDAVLSRLPMPGVPLTASWLIVPADGGLLVRPGERGLRLPGGPGRSGRAMIGSSRLVGLLTHRRADDDRLVAVQYVSVLQVPPLADPITALRVQATLAAGGGVRWEPLERAVAGLEQPLDALVDHVVRAG